MKADLSQTESEVLEVLWGLGEATVRQVAAASASLGRQWAYTTVQTLLHRLREKGYVGSVAGSSPAHVFRPLHTKDEVFKSRLRDLTAKFCDGAAAPLVLSLVAETRFEPEELERLRALIERLTGEQAV